MSHYFFFILLFLDVEKERRKAGEECLLLVFIMGREKEVFNAFLSGITTVDEMQPMSEASRVLYIFGDNAPMHYLNTTKVWRAVVPSAGLALLTEDYDPLIKTFPHTSNIKKGFYSEEVELSLRWVGSDMEPEAIDEFDMMVLEAVYTILKNGSKGVTLSSIYKNIVCDSKARAKTQQENKIIHSLKKLTRTRISITLSKETRERLEEEHKFYVDAYQEPLLNIDADYVACAGNGARVPAFLITKKPILYRYAEVMSQIIAIPSELLYDGSRSTVQNLLIRRRIATRILQLQNNKNGIRIIKIAYTDWSKKKEGKGLYSELGLTADTDAGIKGRVRFRKAVKDYLNYLISIKAIKGYEEYYKEDNKTVAGVELLLNSPDKKVLKEKNKKYEHTMDKVKRNRACARENGIVARRKPAPLPSSHFYKNEEFNPFDKCYYKK